MAKIFFITGAEGVGKSSIIPLLKKNLPTFDIHDFDESGVPENPTTKWRKNTTEYWFSLAKENLKNNISTIICGLSFPTETDATATFILLDVSVKERQNRLQHRNTQEIVEDTEQLLRLREECDITINTTTKSIGEVAQKVVSLLEHHSSERNNEKNHEYN